MHGDIYLEISPSLHVPVPRDSLPSLLDNYDALVKEDLCGLTWVGVEEVSPTIIRKDEAHPGWEEIILSKYHAKCFGGYRCGRGGCFYKALPLHEALVCN